MRNVKLFSYNGASEGAKNLAEALGVKRLKREGSTWNPRGGTVINWGSSVIPESLRVATILNSPEAISEASNKLRFFQKVTGNDLEFLPDWTTDKQVASDWLTEGHTIVSRKILNGHSGAGIELTSKADMSRDDADSVDQGHGASFLPDAPLYTKYFKKISEFRVHIFDGEVIDVQQKKRKTDVPDQEVNWKIRNLDGGFIYAREGVEAPQKVIEAAKKISESFDLLFGAWDVLYNRTDNKAVVLEVNTAPGLAGTTVQKYAEAFKKYLGE